MLNCGSDILDEILGVRKVARDMKGIGFDYNSMNEKENKFVPLEQKTEFEMINYMSKQHAQRYYQRRIPFRKLFGDVTTVENLGRFDPFTTNYMVDPSILTKNNQLSMFNKYERLRRQLQVILITPL